MRFQSSGPSGRDELLASRLVEADLEDVLAIERLSFSRPWDRGHFLFEILENSCAHNLVVRCGGSALAYAIAWLQEPELNVARIAVHPAWRRHGIARRLMEMLLEEGMRQGCSIARLEVRESADAAIRLYHDLGFREEHRRVGYYEADGEDALLMSLILDGAEPRPVG